LHRSMWRSSHRRQVGSLSPRMLSVTGAFRRGLGDFRGLIGRWGSKVPKDTATRGFALDGYASAGIRGEGSNPAPLPPSYDIDLVEVLLIFGIIPPGKPRLGRAENPYRTGEGGQRRLLAGVAAPGRKFPASLHEKAITFSPTICSFPPTKLGK
jgi:hypothetical protein